MSERVKLYLIDLRDYCYYSDFKRIGDATEDGFLGYRGRFAANFLFFYISLLATLAHIVHLIYQKPVAFAIYIKENPVLTLVASFILFGPYFYLIKYLFSVMDSIPIEKEISSEIYIRKRNRSLLLFFSGALCFLLVILWIIYTNGEYKKLLVTI